MSVEKGQCCCKETSASAESHPDHSHLLNRISRISGQIDGVRRMIEDRRYCVDILTQLSAVRGAVASAESEILREHLAHCVTEAFRAGDSTSAEKKIEELLELFRTRTE